MRHERGRELRTKRCVLRPIAPGDAEALHEMFVNPGVRRFLWDDRVIPMQQTVATIAQSQQMFADHGFGLWGVWLFEARTPCGFGGLWPFREPPDLELLYGVAEPFWRRGYATEIAQAVVAYCFGSLGMPEIRASTDAANVASVRVLDKLGFSRVRRATVGGLDTVFFEMKSPLSAG